MKHALIRRKLARVDRALDQAIAKAEVPGAVVLARMPREGELLEHVSVRGNAVLRPERIPMARDTIFDLASLTKPIVTTTSLMLLAAEGASTSTIPSRRCLPAVRRARQGSRHDPQSAHPHVGPEAVARRSTRCCSSASARRASA